MRVKQAQNNMLSHLVLAHTAMFLVAAGGDLRLIQECAEAYRFNSVLLPDARVYVHDLIAFADRLNNSLQRDPTNVEHYDSHDFEVLQNFQPRSKLAFDSQTLMMNSPILGCHSAFLRIYIRVFLLASDIGGIVDEKLLIGDRLKFADIPENTIPLKEHIYARKEAELSGETEWQQLELYAEGKIWLSLPMNDEKQVAEELLAARYPPKGVPELFDCTGPLFGPFRFVAGEVSGEDRLPWEALRLDTGGFADARARVSAIKGTGRREGKHVRRVSSLLMASLRALRQNASAVLKLMESGLAKIGAQASINERRRAFADACRPRQGLLEAPRYVLITPFFDFLILLLPRMQFEHESLMDVEKRFGDVCKCILSYRWV
ncbi:hypothetical protein DFH11DRAFT_1725731 [Phellopilus nigrolimitatus]|nr:hypothetical protein DFH11DRAFT_1725731 [Phellopilus nigrolimitatus]